MAKTKTHWLYIALIVMVLDENCLELFTSFIQPSERVQIAMTAAEDGNLEFSC